MLPKGQNVVMRVPPQSLNLLITFLFVNKKKKSVAKSWLNMMAVRWEDITMKMTPLYEVW